MLEINGSEGGGQILRTALALSAITKTPFKIKNIRGARPKPGLKPQHLKGLETMQKITNAEIIGNKLWSKEITFKPNTIKGGKYFIDIKTAGSISLILQTLVPALLYADKETELEIVGGTAGLWAPSIIFFQQIFCNFLEILGMKREEDFNLKIIKHGFYPKGGGKIVFTIKPFNKFNKISLTGRGRFKRYDCWSIASNQLQKVKVAERQIKGSEEVLNKIEKSRIVYDDTLSPGTLIHIHAHYDNCKLGADILGEKGKKAEEIGKQCALLLKEQINTNACFDKWMGDQILIYMALAGKGEAKIAKITDHVLKNINVIEQFLDVKFRIEGKKDEPGVITCISQ